jgi:hypothetical protein
VNVKRWLSPAEGRATTHLSTHLGGGAGSAEHSLAVELVAGAALLVCIAAFRSRSFFTPLSDPSVGLYQSIGESWLRGHLPYTTTWEYRPPGFFAMWAVAIWIFGAALALNVLALLALGASAIAAAKIAVTLDPLTSRSTGWWAAGFFVLLSPVNDAVAGVAELQLSAFIAWAIYFSLQRPLASRHVLLSGLFAGLAIQCKLTAIPFVLVPLTVVLVASSWPLQVAGLFFAGISAPIVVEILVYERAHELAALWNANVGTTLRYKSPPAEFARNRNLIARQLWTLAPQIELAFLGAFRSVNRSPFASVGWLAAALISIVAAGEFYERQFVLLTAPVALLGALGCTRVLRWLSQRVILQKAFAVLIVLLAFALHDYHEVDEGAMFAWHRLILNDRTWRLDQTEEVAADLRTFDVRNSSLYLIEQSPYLYDLLGVSAPTIYAYSDYLLDPRLSTGAGIDGKAELARILSTRPGFIVLSNLEDFRYASDRVELIKHALETSYTVAYRTKRFTIFRREANP